MLTQQTLKKYLSYDETTGEFTRLIGRSGPNARVGDVAGYIDEAGYRRITVEGVQYRAHQLAWLYVHGEFVDEIDHRNGHRADNKLKNLRSVTRGQNKKNCAVYKNNTTGIRGVSFYKPNGKFKAQIQNDGKKIGLGYFATAEEAGAAYMAASARLHGEFARSG